MILYGIKVVPPEWDDTMPLPFDKPTHDSAKFEQGTRILIYRSGIIGEGEVDGYAIRPAEWPTQSLAHLPPPLAHADYLQPVKLLYTRQDPISPDEVRQALNDPAFPQGEAWRPIDRDIYTQLANWPY